MTRVTNKGLSIRTRITFYAVMLTVAALALISVLNYTLYRNQLKQSIAKHQAAQIASLAFQVDDRLKLVQDQLQKIADSIGIDELSDPDRLQRLLDNKDEARSFYNNGLLVIDAKCRLVIDSPFVANRRGKDYTFRDYATQTLKSGTRYITDPYMPVIPPYTPNITFTAPIKRADGKVIGLLAGRHNLLKGSFLQSIAQTTVSDVGYLYVITTHRALVVHPEKSRIMESVKPGVNAGIDRSIDEGFDGSLENISTKGVSGITSFKHLKNADWIIASHVPLAAIYGPLRVTEKTVIGAFLSITLVSALLIWSVLGKIMSPLQMVINQIGSIHSKQGTERFLPETFDGDLGRLSSAFNNMVTVFDLQRETMILMQNEMLQQKAFAEGLLNKAAVPIFVLDVNNRIIVWNNAIENMTGLKAEDMLGTTKQWLAFYTNERPVLADMILSADKAHLEDLYDTYRMSQHVLGGLQAEGWLDNVGGERRYLLFDAAPVFDANDVKLGVIETLLDITERKLAEAELTKSRAELQRKHNELGELFALVENGKREWEDTLDSLSEMVLLCDQFGVVSRCNRAVITFTRLSCKEIMDIDCMELLARIGLEITSYDGKCGQLECEGGQRHFELLSNELKQIGTDEIRGVVVTIHETTELFKMNEKLQMAYSELQHTQSQILQQEKMASIGQLAAGVAHEINNPMGFISSNLGSLGKYMEKISAFNAALQEAVQSKGDPDTLVALNELRKKMKIDFILGDISGLLAESHDGAERVRRIVQDLKSFSHVDEVECKQFSVNECLKSTLNMARNEIKYVAEVEQEYDPDLPFLNCYPQQLNQVFMNILVNAAHAIEGHGVIKISTLRDADDIVVRISDNGKGIAPEHLSRIFEPFFTTKEVGKGTGLGLSISYDIIKKHGGVINVESEVGVGTTFVIRLPLNHQFAEVGAVS